MKKILALSVVLLASFSLEGKNRGLYNKGNTCFLNTALQPLSHLRPLNEWLAENISAFHTTSLGYQYFQLSQELKKSDTTPVDPELFTENSKKTLGLNVGGQQEDTEEFVTKFIDYINENNQYISNIKNILNSQSIISFVVDQFIAYLRINPFDIKNINKRLKGNSDFIDPAKFTDQQRKDTYKNFSSGTPIWKTLEKDISPLQELVSSFPLLQITTWHYKDKDLHSVTKKESMKFLSIPVQNNNGTKFYSLQQGLDEYLSIEKMEGSEQWHCSECGNKVDAKKKIVLKAPPKNLIFSYSRVVWKPLKKIVKKVKRAIEAPFSLQLVEEYTLETPITYNLIGFGHHGGTASGGHYWAYCFDGKEWYGYNDASVSGPTTNIETILNSGGTYTLFYQIDATDESRLPLKQLPGKEFSFKFKAETTLTTTPPPSKTPPSTITTPPTPTTPPKPSAPPKKNRGLVNVGNTRFLNASVQALSHLTYFNEWLKTNKAAYPSDSLCGQYYDITQELQSSASTSIDPSKFAERCRNVLKLNQNNTQEDVEEFITKFLSRIMETNRHIGIIETTLKKKKITIDMQKEFLKALWYTPLSLPEFNFGAEDEDIWATIKSNVQPLQELVTSFPILQSTVFDKNTSIKSPPKYEPAKIIPLPVKNALGKKLKFLEDCLKEFFTTEYIHDKDTSGTSIDLEKTTSFLSSGKNLILSFKKYEIVGPKGHETIKKINTAINAPLTLHIGTDFGLSSPITYNLVAFICHRGGADGGEYRAYGCLDGTNWFKYHDEKVTGPITDIQKVVSGKETYLLFYEINEKDMGSLYQPAPLKGGMGDLKRTLTTLKAKLVSLTQELAKLPKKTGK
ncbi:ubiquitin carboxyl-terminal hydrolase [Candidatus Babeliales bacterium]|nr:ubiquitin carboxyl-terminal hydrolase [Candidatus Babeliales bacterium]